METFPQIIDANLNRVAEGLRVIEDYVRFVAKDRKITQRLAELRHRANKLEISPYENLAIRDTEKDMRAKEPAAKRESALSLLKANFKRVEEGLRVLEEFSGKSTFSALRYEVYEIEKDVILTLTKKKIRSGIYLISDDPKILEQGMKDGICLAQLRDKKSEKKKIYEEAVKLRKISQKYSVPFIVNDFADIALAVDADGYHSGQDDLPIPLLRKLFGPHKILGRTTHSLAEGLAAQREGADYVSVGPIWETPSKPGREAIGTEYLKEARKKLKIPYVAIGGIDLQNVEHVLKFKPPIIGVVRAFKDVAKMRKKFDSSPEM